MCGTERGRQPSSVKDVSSECQSKRLSRLHRNRHSTQLSAGRLALLQNSTGRLYALTAVSSYKSCSITYKRFSPVETIAKEDCLQAQVNTATHMMSAVVKLEGSWSDGENGENNFSYSEQLMQNSPTSSQSSTSGDGDLDNIGSPVAAHPAGRRKLKRRRKRMLTGVSRQRRAANERERRRIQGVNRAFLELKNALPVSDSAEISKIDILRVAIKWIEHLSELLDQDERMPSEPTSFCDSVEPQLHELLGEEFYINAHELENDDFLQGEDIWSDTSSHLCVHTEEPFLHTLLCNSLQSDTLTLPLLELTDRL